MNYLVSFNSSSNDAKRARQEEELMSAPNADLYAFVRVYRSQWFIRTSESMNAICSRLTRCFQPGDKLLVVEIREALAFPPDTFLIDMIAEIMAWED